MLRKGLVVRRDTRRRHSSQSLLLCASLKGAKADSRSAQRRTEACAGAFCVTMLSVPTTAAVSSAVPMISMTVRLLHECNCH